MLSLKIKNVSWCSIPFLTAILLAFGGCGGSNTGGTENDAGTDGNVQSDSHLSDSGFQDGSFLDDGGGDTSVLTDGQLSDGAINPDATVNPDGSIEPDAAPTPCTTRITYGSSWMHGPNHPQDYDIAEDYVIWEGALVEGPWMIERNGYFYLFYSGNGYASPNYGVGVARATSPLGPFTKASEPILQSKGAWQGPGHGSIIQGPSGGWVQVYHSWVAGSVGQSPGRLVLVDRIQWDNNWPVMRGAPSSRSQPLP